MLNWIELYESHFDFLKVHATDKTLGKALFLLFLKMNKVRKMEESGTHKNKKGKTLYC